MQHSVNVLLSESSIDAAMYQLDEISAYLSAVASDLCDEISSKALAAATDIAPVCSGDYKRNLHIEHPQDNTYVLVSDVEAVTPGCKYRPRFSDSWVGERYSGIVEERHEVIGAVREYLVRDVLPDIRRRGLL